MSYDRTSKLRTCCSHYTISCNHLFSLQAVVYLYQFGVQPLAHIQTGNLFLDGEVCRLGGYENRLLGYRPHLYELSMSSGCFEDIDIFMFGECSWIIQRKSIFLLSI